MYSVKYAAKAHKMNFKFTLQLVGYLIRSSILEIMPKRLRIPHMQKDDD